MLRIQACAVHTQGCLDILQAVAVREVITYGMVTSPIDSLVEQLIGTAHVCRGSRRLACTELWTNSWRGRWAVHRALSRGGS